MISSDLQMTSSDLQWPENYKIYLGEYMYIPPNKKEKKEHDDNMIQTPWKGVAVVAA